MLAGDTTPEQFAALTDAASIQREFAEGCDASATCDTARFPLSTEVTVAGSGGDDGGGGGGGDDAAAGPSTTSSSEVAGMPVWQFALIIVAVALVCCSGVGAGMMAFRKYGAAKDTKKTAAAASAKAKARSIEEEEEEEEDEDEESGGRPKEQLQQQQQQRVEVDVVKKPAAAALGAARSGGDYANNPLSIERQKPPLSPRSGELPKRTVDEEAKARQRAERRAAKEARHQEREARRALKAQFKAKAAGSSSTVMDMMTEGGFLSSGGVCVCARDFRAGTDGGGW